MRIPAKVNLCLYVGPRRPDGYHDLLSVIQSIALYDELELRDHDGPADEVRCAGVEGPNLAAGAIAAFRESTGWDGPPQLLVIDKRIPVAAGLGGGSADAAGALRLLRDRSGLGTPDQLHAIATSLGADVPSQLQPGRYLAAGIGEQLTPLPIPDGFGVVVLPSKAALSTKAVYEEADRLGLTRTSAELERLRTTLTGSTAIEPHNDLEPAARSLEHTIEATLQHLPGSIVAGSGPTVIALFPTLQDAERAAERLVAAGIDALAAGAVHNSSSA
jgi:4-diphosphocytidyl-2-C-methyl-D-erythritol kinase